jgi:uncharacterized membrane protein YqiK
MKLQVGAEAAATKLRAEAEAEATRQRAAAQADATKLNAEADAERIAKTGNAEAEKILAIGRSTAEAYELQVKAMGDENFTRFKITEEIAKGHIRIIPDVVINGNGGSSTDGSLSGLLGMKLLEITESRQQPTEERKEVRRVPIVPASEKEGKE